MISTVARLMDKVTEDVSFKLKKEINQIEPSIQNQITQLQNKIPSPETIKNRICRTPDINVAKKMYNQLNDELEKINDMIEKTKSSIDRFNDKINVVRALLEGLLDIANTLVVVLEALKLAIPALDAALASQTVPHINGLTVIKLKENKDDLRDKIDSYSNIARGIAGKINFIIPKLNIIENRLSSLNSLPDLPSGLLEVSKEELDNCMKERLIEISPPADSLEDGAEGGVDAQNQTLDSLIDKENRNQENTTKIEEFGYEGFPKTEEYTVKTIPSEDLEN